MRRRSAVAAALLACGCAATTNYTEPDAPRYLSAYGAAPQAREEIRVVTFNTNFARRLDLVLGLLEANPELSRSDVLVLQEVDAPAVEQVARRLRLNSVYYPSTLHPISDRDFGVAVLSPWPLESPRKLVLPHAHWLRKVRRAAVRATANVGGTRVRVYGVHLEAPFGISGRSRREQVQAVLADAQDAREPVVVAGDFNQWAAARLLADAGFAWPTRDVGDTIGFFSFDHILVRGLSPRATRAAGSVDERGASDHKPVWTVLQAPLAPERAALFVRSP